MTDKLFNRKYRTQSTRLSNWDYGCNAAYYITICIKGRQQFFGEVIERKMVLSEIGEIAQKCWIEIPNHFPFVKLDAFIIMPDHMHGIIVIDKPIQNEITDVETQNLASLPVISNAIVETQNLASLPVVSNAIVETQNLASLPVISGINNNISNNKFGPQSKNLASIVRGYKIGVTQNARHIDANFTWQPRYYDTVIKDNEMYFSIRDCIVDNPAKWGRDAKSCI